MEKHYEKGIRNLIIILLAAVAAFVYYYISLPAINIHSSGFWMFIITIIVVVIAVYIVRKAGKEYVESEVAEKFGFKFSTYGLKDDKVLKGLGILLLLVVAVYLLGSILSSPIVNAKKYQALLTIEEREFTEDIKEVDYRTIPLLDKESAALLGNRKMGSMVDMVSQFEVAGDYSQINYKGVPVRVTPLLCQRHQMADQSERWHTGLYSDRHDDTGYGVRKTGKRNQIFQVGIFQQEFIPASALPFSYLYLR